MQRRTKFILGGISGALLLAGATVYSVGVPTVAGHAASLIGPKAALAASGHHRGWGQGRGRGFARICSDQRSERLENAIEFADAFLKLEAGQTEAWTKLTASLRAGSARVGKACDTLKTEGWPDKAPGKLAAVETVMTAGLDIVKEVRPSFDAFYATLDDKQKAAIDGLLDRHRR